MLKLKKMKLTEGLKTLGLAGIISLSSCMTITPKASIDIAYIPQRTDDRIIKHEMMTELDAGLEAKLVEGKLKNLKIGIGGRQRTYFSLQIPSISSLNRQEYDIYGSISYENLKFYIEHMCSHPIAEKEFWVHDEKTGKQYLINYDSLTKIGIRLEF